MRPTIYDNDQKLYELVIEDDSDEVFAISFVNAGAIEKDFIYFNKAVVNGLLI